jgi:hypothetical protein
LDRQALSREALQPLARDFNDARRRHVGVKMAPDCFPGL